MRKKTTTITTDTRPWCPIMYYLFTYMCSGKLIPWDSCHDLHTCHASPCRAYTPKLAALYSRAKAQHMAFEVVFISLDGDEESMDRYVCIYGILGLGAYVNFKPVVVSYRLDHQLYGIRRYWVGVRTIFNMKMTTTTTTLGLWHHTIYCNHREVAVFHLSVGLWSVFKTPSARYPSAMFHLCSAITTTITARLLATCCWRRSVIIHTNKHLYSEYIIMQPAGRRCLLHVTHRDRDQINPPPPKQKASASRYS